MGVKENMVYGLKMYFSALIRGEIIPPGSMPKSLVETIYVKKIEGDIIKADDPCKSVLDMMKTSYPEPIKTFFTESGKRYAMTRNPSECKRFLNDYLHWLTSKIDVPVELPDIPDIKMPDINIDMPSINFPSFPDTGGLKQSLQVSAIVLIGVVLLIIYMLTGRGKKGVTVVT